MVEPEEAPDASLPVLRDSQRDGFPVVADADAAAEVAPAAGEHGVGGGHGDEAEQEEGHLELHGGFD